MQLLNKPSTIKITSCKDQLLWYWKHIGEEFVVIRTNPDVYWVREKDQWQSLNFVHKEDAAVV